MHQVNIFSPVNLFSTKHQHRTKYGRSNTTSLEDSLEQATIYCHEYRMNVLLNIVISNQQNISRNREYQREPTKHAQKFKNCLKTIKTLSGTTQQTQYINLSYAIRKPLNTDCTQGLFRTKIQWGLTEARIWVRILRTWI